MACRADCSATRSNPRLLKQLIQAKSPRQISRGYWIQLFPYAVSPAIGLSLATTGSCIELACGGAVAIAGKPYFQDLELADQARQESPAAAMAAAYSAHGEAAFNKVLGSFCCAIIDLAKNQSLLGIDRLGQHSLYYQQSGSALQWGSTIAGVPRDELDPLKLQNQGIYNYVYYHMVPAPRVGLSKCKETASSPLRKNQW